MKNAAGWTVTVELKGGSIRDIYSKKTDRDHAHADVTSFCVESIVRVVTSTKA